MSHEVDLQIAVCDRYQAIYQPVDVSATLGIARNVKSKILPINGLRIHPEGETSGWYIWAEEELSNDPQYFVPLHTHHLPEWCPMALPYLGLPPGWRFLVTPNYEDVWYDPDLLNGNYSNKPTQ